MSPIHETKELNEMKRARKGAHFNSTLIECYLAMLPSTRKNRCMSRSRPWADEIIERLMDLVVGLKRRARADYAGQALPYPQHAVLKQLEKDGSATVAASLLTLAARRSLASCFLLAGADHTTDQPKERTIFCSYRSPLHAADFHSGEHWKEQTKSWIAPPQSEESVPMKARRPLRVTGSFLALGAACVVSLGAAHAAVQELPPPLSPPTEDARRVLADSLPELARVPGGWTADSVGERARKTSFDVAAKEASLHAAQARVSAAVVAFFPRLSGLATYTRYQDVAQPSLGTFIEPSTPVQPGPIASTTQLSAIPLTIRVPLDYWVAQATLTIPLSDYVLRLSQQYGASNRRRDAARFDQLASEAQAFSDARIAFYQYVKVVAQHGVLVQSKTVADAHLVDAQNLFRAGRGSNADHLAAEANVASAQLAVDQATELIGVAEEQLRLATHAPPNEPVSIGEDVTSPLHHDAYELAALKQEAAAGRPEIQALLLGAAAQDQLAKSARAAQWPSVSAFGDYVYANPSPRIFDPEKHFVGYWDVGVRVSWAINDVFSAGAAGADQKAQAVSLRAQSSKVSDAVFLEVAQAVLAMRTADSSIESSNAQLRSAEEAYRARRDLFRYGRGTSVELADAEADLFRARLAAISAGIDQRLAKVRIEHATGRDVTGRGP